ncbi:ABC transporter substrate-binding protein [Microbacterium sp. RG1]|uniref:ABC transporter substrate-binding protein n=1 Tax=Microbacterium sp. RG1 TaxID=2489212 RepID=UPI0010CA4E70|nr:ABC transporter substrate-binding protein [Microbacterium sp. RG1]QCQ16607.1 ABC transporter [Microbacterium sp. RG1]
MKFRKALVVAAAAAALTLSGCAAGGTSVPTDSTLTVGFNSPPISLDPLRAANGQGRWYEDPAYMSVLQIDDDNNVVAGLADKWGYVGDDNTTFRFTLREGLTFADGTPVNAQAVVDSFDYFLANGSGPTRAYFLGMTATALDDTEVELKTQTPNPIIDQLLTQDYYAFSPISAAGLADDNARAGQTFGVGPYVLDTAQTVPDSTYVYVRNDAYFDKDAAKYEKIEIKVIPDAAQLVQALNTGQVEVIQVDANVANTVSDNVVMDARVGAWNGLYLTDRNGTVVPALADPKVRQALALAIDRPAVATAALGEYGEPAYQVALQGDPSWGYDPSLEGLYDKDVDAAKALLAEAGYPDGFSFTVLFQGPSPSDSKLAQALAAQFQEIGVTMELKSEPDFGAWVNDFVSGQYPATIFGGSGLPMYLMSQFAWTPDAIMNPYKVSNDDVNAAFDTLSRASGEDAVTAAQALTAVVTEQALTIPVVNQKLIYAHAKSVDGFRWIGDTGLPNSILSWSPAS